MTQRSRAARGPGAAAGFTLIELMVVVIILGILATIIVPRILDRPEQARRVKARVQIKILQSALQLYKLDTGRYPSTAEGLKALVADPGERGWRQGGYLEGTAVPSDPWGHPYLYLSPGTHSKDFDIESLGRDGESGGTGNDADIQSWNPDQE